MRLMVSFPLLVLFVELAAPFSHHFDEQIRKGSCKRAIRPDGRTGIQNNILGL
jgi:hypothetical protein